MKTITIKTPRISSSFIKYLEAQGLKVIVILTPNQGNKQGDHNEKTILQRHV